jgi:hypothetical protein
VMNARRFNATATVETKASSKAASRDLRLFAPQTVPLLPIYPDR